MYIWFVIGPQDTKLYIDTCESDFDTVLGIFTSKSNIYEPNSVSYIKTNDDGACSSTTSPTGSTIVIDIVEGTTYYIMVDGFTENSAGKNPLESLYSKTWLNNSVSGAAHIY